MNFFYSSNFPLFGRSFHSSQVSSAQNGLAVSFSSYSVVLYLLFGKLVVFIQFTYFLFQKSYLLNFNKFFFSFLEFQLLILLQNLFIIDESSSRFILIAYFPLLSCLNFLFHLSFNFLAQNRLFLLSNIPSQILFVFRFFQLD